MRINANKYPILAFLRNPRPGLEVFLPEGEIENGGYTKSRILFDDFFDNNATQNAPKFAQNITIMSKEFVVNAYRNREKIMTVQTMRELTKTPQIGVIVFDGFVVLYLFAYAGKDNEGEELIGGASIAFNGKNLISIHTGYGSYLAPRDYKKLMGIEVDVETFEYLALEALLFKKYAEIETVDAKMGKKVDIPDSKEKLLWEFDMPATYVDCSWFREIVRKEGFMVRGHFRLQPYKKGGEWTKKLIYIEPFQKHGYTRRAKIELQ